jgi:flagellar motor component MotA
MAEKVGSGVKTIFLVYSDTDENAKEEVTLNGWKVLEIKNVEDAAAFTAEKKVTNMGGTVELTKDNNTAKKISDKKKTPERKKKVLKNIKKFTIIQKRSGVKALKAGKQEHQNPYCKQINLFLVEKIGDNETIDNGKMDLIRYNIASVLEIPDDKILIKINDLRKGK